MNLKGRHLLKIMDLTPEEMTYLIDLAADLRNIFSDRHRSLPPCVFLIGCLSVIE